MNGKTVFKTTSNSTSNFKINKSIFIQNSGVTSVITQSDDSIYKALSDFAVTLDTLLNDFSEGKFQEVALILTREKYNSLSVQLSKLQRPQNQTYENLRILIQASLQGLYQAIQQYANLINTQSLLINQTNRANILNSIESIKEYIKSLKKRIQIFPDEEITTISVKISPEYAEYIKLYGYPPGGVFDMQLLADIINRLNIVI